MCSIALQFFGCDVGAQRVPPDAGTLLQQLEQERQFQPPQPKKPLTIPEPESRPGGDLLLTVNRFVLSGNRLIDDERLAQALAPWLNRPLDFAELQKAPIAVAALYREAGWVVRTYLPAQEVADGLVRIVVIEAVFGDVQVEVRDGVRLDPAAAKRMVLAAQPSGLPLSASAVDRALLLLEDMPGLAVQGDLKEGKAEAETDLLLQLQPLPLLSGEAAMDNTGSRSTGVARWTGSVSAASPLGLGDLAGVTLLHSQGSDFGRLAWSLPVGSHGLRAEISHSQLAYRVIAPEFASLDAKGSSRTTGLNFSYPFLRMRAANLYLLAGLERKRFLNESNGAVVSDYGLTLASLGVSGVRHDEFAGGGSTSGSLSLISGKVDLGGSPNEASDAAGPRTAGGYRKLRVALQRTQAVTQGLMLSASLQGQFASRNLDSSERFYLGGTTGVRAYPTSEAGGSEGSLLTIEARQRLASRLTLSVFHDNGRVLVLRNRDFQGAAAVNGLRLQGAGLALSWAGPGGANARISWARRVGRHPNPTSEGKDQDGTLVLNRFWIHAQVPF